MAHTPLLKTSWLLLKVTFGLLAIIAGLDKFFDILVEWEGYLSPFMRNLIPFEVQTFMYLVGVIEIGAGILVLSKWTEIGAYIVAVWLALISLNLLMLGSYDIAVRDIVMAISALALGLMTRAAPNAYLK